jgi:GNAT superfamily N-acetyltransferase
LRLLSQAQIDYIEPGSEAITGAWHVSSDLYQEQNKLFVPGTIQAICSWHSKKKRYRYFPENDEPCHNLSAPLKESANISQIHKSGSIKRRDHMQIQAIKKVQCPEAKEVILSGFLERFGFIDHSLNPDIQDIWTEYMQGDGLFYVGMDEGRMVCTGAIRKEDESTYQVVRMSVLKAYRKHGIGRRMLAHLEGEAQSLGARTLILETNKRWEDAIHFYKKNGYSATHEDEVSCYFQKEFPL